MEFLLKVWRGEKSLPFTYWLCYFVPGVAIVLLTYGLVALTFRLDAAVYDTLYYALLALTAVITYGCGIAVIRSAGNRKPVGFWGGAACIVVVLGMIRLPLELFVGPMDERDWVRQVEIMNAGLPQRADEITTLNRIAYDKGRVTYSFEIDASVTGPFNVQAIKAIAIPDFCGEWRPYFESGDVTAVEFSYLLRGEVHSFRITQADCP